jgi:hypothetical protein
MWQKLRIIIGGNWFSDMGNADAHQIQILVMIEDHLRPRPKED